MGSHKIRFYNCSKMYEMGVDEMRIIRTTEAPRWEKNSPDSSLPIEEYYQRMLEFAKTYTQSDMEMTIVINDLLLEHKSSKVKHTISGTAVLTSGVYDSKGNLLYYERNRQFSVKCC